MTGKRSRRLPEKSDAHQAENRYKHVPEAVDYHHYREGIMEFIWIRHGMTEGNRRQRYIGGRTDEGLCEAGRKVLRDNAGAGLYPRVDLVYVSPMKRCLETAQILYPDTARRIVEGFRECDFGLFENHNDEELATAPFYQKWLTERETAPFPAGEHPEDFKRRCREALSSLTEQEEMPERTAFVVHGGVIMAILSGLDENRGDFYEYYTCNGEGYVCRAERRGKELVLRDCQRLTLHGKGGAGADKHDK